MASKKRPASQPQSIPLSLVIVSPERRARLKEPVVEMLVLSIERRGLLSPIRVTSSSEPDKYDLVTGLHRLVAHERLGREEIDAVIAEGDAIDLELDEIEENLARKDLTVLERAQAEKRQKDLYEKRHPETRRGVAGGKARQGQQTSHVSFADSKESGTRSVQRRIQIAENLSDEVVAVLADTPTANSLRQLQDLIKQPEDLRLPIAMAISSGKAKTVAAAASEVRGIPKVAPPPREREARARIRQTSNGRTGTTFLLGRRITVRLDEDGRYVDLKDEGPGVPVPTYPDDADPVSMDTFEATLRQVLGELPDSLKDDVVLLDIRRAMHVIDGTLMVRDRMRGLGMRSAATVAIKLTWWPSDIEKPVGAIVWDPMIDGEHLAAWVCGTPSKGQLRAGFRRFLNQEVLRRSHGFTHPVTGTEELSKPQTAKQPRSPKASRTSNRASALEVGLINMGFKPPEVKAALAKLGGRVESEPADALMREALALLTQADR